MVLTWSVELVTRIEIIPRLEYHLIDDLFYQDDEIGEMRHTAFMVECGLEEDPPDGPDVDPIPWGDVLLLKIQQEQEQNRKNEDDGVLDEIADDSEFYEEDCSSSSSSSSSDISFIRWHRILLSRSRSMDDRILLNSLAIEPTSRPRVGRHHSLGALEKETGAAWNQNIKKLKAGEVGHIPKRMSSLQLRDTQYASVA
jgi:hypothetical protein